MCPGEPPERDQPLDDLLRDPADDALAAGMERHPRSDHRRRRGAAEEPVALDEQRARAGARRRQRRGAAGVAAADDQHVVLHHGLHFANGGQPTAAAEGAVWTAA